MGDMRKSINELVGFMHKHDVQGDVRVSIVFQSDRDKAYFVRGLQGDLKDAVYDSTKPLPISNDEFSLYGIRIRLLS